MSDKVEKNSDKELDGQTQVIKGTIFLFFSY